MGAAYFYHLTRNSVEETLGLLVEKSLAAGWRIEIRGRSEAVLQKLDRALWMRDGFLPHGMAGGAHDALQPVLLTTAEGGNGANCIMSVEGVDISPEDIAASERVSILFDGHDPQGLDAARAQWKMLKDAGTQAQYWSEESGRWEKKASANEPE